MKRMSMIHASAVSVLLLSGACDEGGPTPDESAEEVALDDAEFADALVLEDGEEMFGEDTTVLAQVELGGTVLSFVELDVDGDVSVGILEEQPPGSPSLAAAPGLEGASALDVFLAITEADVDVPEGLLALSEDQQLGERGWLAATLADVQLELPLTAEGRTAAAGTACESGFESWLINWLPPHGGSIGASASDRKWDLSSDPGVDPDWWGPIEPLTGQTCSDCTESWYYRRYFSTQWEIYNKDEIKMGVAACDIGWRPAYNPGGSPVIEHLGPRLSFEYRTENNASTHKAWSKDLAASDEGKHYRWYWRGTSAAGNNDFDWKIEVQHARATDLFDFGWLWNNNGW